MLISVECTFYYLKYSYTGTGCPLVYKNAYKLYVQYSTMFPIFDKCNLTMA